MNFFCSQINNGYIANLKYVFLPYKQKYIHILMRLYDLNLIGNFNIQKYKIKIVLKYYNNKPLFFLKQGSSQGGKKYYQYRKLIDKNNNFNFILISNNMGYLTYDDTISLGLGGEYILKVCLLFKNIIY